jgi:hypothetical protein
MDLNLNEISDIEAIGSNGSSTITAAAILLNTMMQKFNGHLGSNSFQNICQATKLIRLNPQLMLN